MEKIDRLLFSFGAVTKQEWLAKVEKDLKGRPLSDLNWHLGQEMLIDPFSHVDDQNNVPEPILRTAAGNNWEIGEIIPVYDSVQANRWALDGLQGGVEAIRFELFRELSSSDWEQLFQDIDLALISVHLVEMYDPKNPIQLANQLRTYGVGQGVDPALINGSIEFDPESLSLDQTAEIAVGIHKLLPAFKSLHVDGSRHYFGPKGVGQELWYIIARGAAFCYVMKSKGFNNEEINEQMKISVALSTSYFVAIAKLRALRILWLNVLKGMDSVGHSFPEIIGHIAKGTQGDNQYTNMIRASTQAMSAVIGGVDRLYILPANSPNENVLDAENAFIFSRRIARNVQHILKMESHFAQVADPGAGSYYMEQLTEKIVQEAWSVFLTLEDRATFYV